MNSPHVPNFSFFMNKTNRLRDVLVPIEVFIDMMNYLEDTNIQMRFSDDSKEHSNLWICPYPYPAPAKGFVQCNGDSISDYARYQEAIYTIIGDRIGVLKDNAITEDFMNHIDNDPDVGAIVHMTSGRIVPFRYSCTDDLQILNVRNALPDLIKDMKSDNFEDLSKTINYLKNFSADQKYRMLYCFHYIKEDSFNPKGIPLLAGKGLTAMDLEINLDISSYIIDQYKKHEKIICVA